MADLASNSDLLRSLGRLVRGLSSLFWGLPGTLLVAFYTAKTDGLRAFGVVPSLVCTGWLSYGLWQLGAFQPQERVWRSALDRALLLSFILCGLSPFLYWSTRVPDRPFFGLMRLLLSFFALLFLGSLNLVLQRLGAMLPDEGLRQEIRQFTGLNLNLLLAMLLLCAFSLGLGHLWRLPLWLALFTHTVLDQSSLWFLVPLVLLPLAMTMALLWKTKEAILESIFGGH